ncbi:ParA family protein [Salinispora vitiensis]|uniref:ParA family protein n=1 Tax=Salinispora vitiensis TaxID=999544 RepID=UPI0003824523|nr:AAA family ATPase [Salinispora vitiensis]
MATTILINSNKGGVGKSAQCRELACALARAGWQVDVADMAPQGNTTRRFGIDRAALAAAGHPGTADLIDPTKNITYHQTLVPVEWDVPWTGNIRVAPSLNAINMQNRNLEAGRPGAERRLFAALRGQTEDRHVVLIDTDPGMDHLMAVALAAADGLLITVELDYDAVEGGVNVVSYLNANKVLMGLEDVRVVGVVVTKARRELSATARVQEENLPQAFAAAGGPELIWTPSVPLYDTLAAALSDAQPLEAYNHPSARRLEDVFAAHAAQLVKAIGY